MKRRLQFKWTYAVLFAVVFAASAAMMVPAQWLGTVLDSATAGRIRIVGATGFPWSGRGDVIVRLDDGDITLRNTAWRWLPARLFVGDLAVELKFTGDPATGRAVIARRATAIVVREADVAISAAALSEGVAKLRGWQPGGTLNFRTQGLALKRHAIAGEAELTWQGAAAATAPLGDYRFLVHAEGAGPAHLEIATLRGPLHLAGSGDFGPNEGLRVRGTATPAAEYRAQLLPLLALLGTDRGDGAVFFDIALVRKGSA